MDLGLLKSALEGFEKQLATKVQQAALSVVDEYPSKPGDAHVVVTNAGVSKASNVLEFWTQFDIEGQRDAWQSTCTRLQALHQAPKPSSAEELRARTEVAESQLLDICTKLVQSPDPVPLLHATTQLTAKLVAMEQQRLELQQEAATARMDSAEVLQLVEKHRSLEAAHKGCEAQVASLKAQLVEAQAAIEENRASAQQAAELSTEVARLQAALQALRAEYEVAQATLFDITAQREDAAKARDEEAEMTALELERCRAALRDAVREREAATAKLKELAGEGSGAAGAPGDEWWAAQLSAREADARRLQEDLDRAHKQLRDSKAAWGEECSTLKAATALAQQQSQRLQRELALRADPREVQELRGRVEALQAVVDTQMEAEGLREPANDALLRSASSASALQPLLQERNRRLAGEVSSLRRQLAEADEQLQAAGGRAAELEAQLQQRASLIQQLEEDLARSCAGPATAPTAIVTVDIKPNSPLPGGQPQQPPPASTQPSMLDIVAGQRDRFKARCQQLEEANAQLQELAAARRREAEAIQRDNVELVEKIRYLEAYSQQHRGVLGGSVVRVVKVDEAGALAAEAAEEAKANRYQCGPLSIDIGGGKGGAVGAHAQGLKNRRRRKEGAPGMAACWGADDEEGGAVAADAEGRYTQLYEARLNPFAKFQQAELAQHLGGMMMHDRAILSGSRMLLGSRMARTFLALYAVLLHGFLLLLLYFAAMPCQLDSPQQLAAAPAAAAPKAHTAARALAAAGNTGLRLARALLNSL